MLDKSVITVYTVYIQRGGISINIFIDNKSGAPIYDQICMQIRAQILGGDLPEDTALPSIRALAKDLRISVITTKRAYEELEKEGLIYTLPGKGSFVAGRNPALAREENLRQIEQHMIDVRDLAKLAGLNRKEILEMWDLMWEEET